MISALSTSTDTSSAAVSNGKRPSAEDVFKKLDSDSKGYLTESDLVKLSPAGLQAADADAEAAKAFKQMDTDADGKVTESEFKAAEPPQQPAGGEPAGGGGRTQGGGGAGAASSSTPSYDPADANKDGKVSQQEQLSYDAQQAAKQNAATAGTAVSPQAAEAVKAYEAVSQTTQD